MAVNPLDVYSTYLNPDLDPDAKRARIDMLYGIAAPAPGPDTRTAEADPSVSFMLSTGDQPPAPPPVATDAGGMSMAPQMSSAPAMSVAPPPSPAPPPAPAPTGGASMPAPVASEATQSTISPEALAAEAARKASTQPPPAAPAPPPPSGQELTNEVLKQMVQNQLRGGGPVRVVAEHDQPVGSVVESKAPIPQEIKDRLTDDAKKEAQLSIEQGDQAAKGHLDLALLADQQAREARADKAAQIEKQRLAEEHIQRLDLEHAQLVKDTEEKPGDFWAEKTGGQKVLTLISAIMFGLAQKPDGIQELVNRSIARRAANREKTLGASKSKIDSFRSRMMSPEAAHQAELSLGARAVAADATRLAETAQSAEARTRGLQLAQHFLTQADQHDEEMARLESAATRTQIKHVPRTTTGGPANFAAAIDQVSKATGTPKEKVFRAWIGAGGGEAMSAEERGQAESELGRTVVFPGPEPEKLYARPGETNEVQEGVRAASEILDAYDQLEKLASKPGHSLSPDDTARIQGLLSSNLLRLATSNKLGAISEGDRGLINPLAGVAAGETFAFDSATRSGIKQARQLIQNRLNTLKKTLFKKPFSNTETGGTTAASVEVPAS